MGYDIYPGLFVLRHGTASFKAIPDDCRCYEFFGCLAGVREADVKAISEPRGLPIWFHDEFYKWWKDVIDGEHSASWVTLAEVKERFLTDKTLDTRTAEIARRWIALAEFYASDPRYRNLGEDAFVFVFNFDS